MEHDISARDAGLPVYPKGQGAFGERIVEGKVVSHKGKQRIIEKLFALKSAGNSYAELVKWFNENDIPTKNKFEKRSRMSVYDIKEMYLTQFFSLTFGMI